MKKNLPTTIFVVDDDEVVLKRFAKESLRNTNLGVLTAKSLDTAANLFDNGPPVGAVLVDIHFRDDTQDPSRSLFDGLSFLEYVKRKDPHLPVYVMSMDTEDRATKQQAKELGLHIGGWYDKLRNREQFSPWIAIERDLILQALKAEPEFRDSAAEHVEDPSELITDEKVAEKVRTIFNYPRLTYLQYLPEDCGYSLKVPLAVHCWPEDDEIVAKPVKIPLLVEGRGRDSVEALEDLADHLVKEYHDLATEQVGQLEGYAAFIKVTLDGIFHVDSKPNSVRKPSII